MNEKDFLKRAKMIEWLNSKKSGGRHDDNCMIDLDPEYYGPCTCTYKERSKDNNIIEEIKAIIMKG